MINPDTIEAIDLLQARFLSRLFFKEVRSLVVKGGMAMRLAHHHSRHTKDIDLDAEHDIDLICIQRLIRDAIKQATLGGWLEEVQITEPKQTHTTARWKINGVEPKTKKHINMTVEISFRNHLKKEEIRMVESQEHGMKMVVPVYQDEVLVINKINALLSRDAPRDVIDLFLLFRSGVEIDPGHLSERCPESNMEECIKRIWQKLEMMDEQVFQEQIAPIWNMSVLPLEWQDWLKIRMYVEEQVEMCLKKVQDHRQKTKE